MPWQGGEGGCMPPVRHPQGCECPYCPKKTGLETSRSPGRRSCPPWEEMIPCQQPALIPLPHYRHPQLMALEMGPDWGIAQPCGRTLRLSRSHPLPAGDRRGQEPLPCQGQQPGVWQDLGFTLQGSGPAAHRMEPGRVALTLCILGSNGCRCQQTTWDKTSPCHMLQLM